MYLFRGGEGTPEMSPEQSQEHMQKWFGWMQQLSETGNMVAGDPLQRAGKQVNGKNKVVTDGPFVEAKEIVGGYLIVSAKDIDDALELSKGCPIFDFDGKLEVRPIQKLDM